MAQEEKTKKKNRLLYMILSVVIAVIAWTLVIYVTDPDITKTFSGIHVGIVGEDALRDKGYVVVNRDDIPKTSLKLRGKRSDIMKSLERAKVEIDVSVLEADGEAMLEPSPRLSNTRIVVERIGDEQIPVMVEKLSTKDVPIRIIQIGTQDGKLIKSKAAQDAVTLEGASSELENIDAVEVMVDISTLTESGAGEYSYSLMLADGVDREDLYTINIEENLITIQNTVYAEKEVPIKVSAKTEQEYKLLEKDTVTEPKTVKVGVSDGVEIEYVEILLDENADDGDYKLEKRDGIYIPDSARTVRVKPEWEKKTDT